MAAFRNLAGLKFGRWTVLHWTRKKYAEQFWLCRCDCGTVREVIGGTLKTGKSTSCGCYSRERATKHGKEGTRIYNTWAQMLSRCNNPKAQSYPHYGAKGIKVCDRWKDFSNFYADMGDIPEGKTLDRIDGEKGYEPTNCKWSSYKEQARNKSTLKLFPWEGRMITIAEIAEMSGMKRKVVENRIRLGMSMEDALKNVRYNRWTTPLRK